MASIYDGYQLANSNSVKTFQGSALPEMMKVSDIMQQRYDATEAYKEQLQLAQQSASPFSKDQALYQQVEKGYQEKLAALTNRPDLENVTKDVARLGREYAMEYKQFADNKARVMAAKEELDKAVTSGYISRDTADKKLSMVLSRYQGLQKDPTSGKYANAFGNVTWAREVDMSEKIRKAVGDIVADKVESVSEAKDGSGDYMVTTSSGTKWVSGKEVQEKLWAAYSNDAEWQADVNQKVEIGTWEESLKLPKEKRTPEAIQALASAKHKEVLKNIGIVADKYAFTERSSGRTLDETAQATEKAKNAADLLEVSVSAPGSGLVVTSPGDVDAKIAEHDNAIKTGVQSQAQWEAEQKRLSDDGKIYKYSDGRVFVLRDGKRTEITDAANDQRMAIKRAETEKKKLETVKAEAAKVAGYDPKNLGSVTKGADNVYKESLKYNLERGTIITGTGPKGATTRRMTEAEAHERAARARDQYIANNKDKVPGYEAYQEELRKRLNPTAESSTVVTINDKATKDLWSSNLQGLVSSLGLKNGSIGLKIGSGPNQGTDLTDEDYNEIKGDLDVVGFESDKSGNTVLKVRAYKDAKGKKTEGQDILVNLGSTTADKWLQAKMKPEAYHKFKVSGMIKGALSNDTRSATLTVPGTDIPVKVEKEGSKWAVTLPGKDGNSRQLAETYEGIYNILMQYSQQQ